MKPEELRGPGKVLGDAFPWSQAEEREAVDGARCGGGLRQGRMERRGHGEERVDPWLFL